MYSRRLINLENNTQTREENLYSERLLNLESAVMDEQRHSPEKAKTPEHDACSSETKNSQDVKDEPTDFLDDLLESAERIAQAAAPPRQESSVKPEPEECNDEEVDPNFFEDLLQLAEQERRKNPAPDSNLKRERTNEDADTAPKKKKSKHDDVDKKPRLKIRSDLGLFPVVAGPSKPVPARDPLAESLLFMNELMAEDMITDPETTAQEKMTKALERIIYARRAFEKARSQSEKKFFPKSPVFLFTQTIRKLPSSTTHFTQQIYDNRSPLHTVNNVSFSFNSTTTRLNLHDWGIEAPPPAALKVARILGYDAETLYLKRSSIKIPDRIQKNQNTATEADTLFEQSSSTLFINAMVQTDEVRIVPLRRAEFYRNVGTQYNPQTAVAGTQTSAAYCGSTVSDLPLMRMINDLNENQLQAVEDFVQLITEPAGHAGIDIYQKRSRLHEIYKTSQQPSIFSSSPMPQAPPPPSMRSFNEDTDEDYSNYSRTEIKREYSRDPRTNQNRARPSPYQGGQLEPISANSIWNGSSSNSAPKFYGRGGKRR